MHGAAICNIYPLPLFTPYNRIEHSDRIHHINRSTLELNLLYPRFPIKAQLILFRLHVEYLYNIPL